MMTNTLPQAQQRHAMSMPGALLRLEGLAIFGAAIYLYANGGASWILFAVLLLSPDLAMLAYLLNPHAGTIVYNLAHTYALPLLLGLVSWTVDAALGQHLALIWLAHIGMDRMVGYGLKYTTGFKDTHLGRV